MTQVTCVYVMLPVLNCRASTGHRLSPAHEARYEVTTDATILTCWGFALAASFAAF